MVVANVVTYSLWDFDRVAVWLDYREARIFQVRADGFTKETIEAPHRHIHRHPKGEEMDKNRDKRRPDDAHRFFRELALALVEANEVLIVGPSTAKLHFVNHAHQHDQALLPKIVGLETVDHPTDGQLVAYAKHYFKNWRPVYRGRLPLAMVVAAPPMVVAAPAFRGAIVNCGDFCAAKLKHGSYR